MDAILGRYRARMEEHGMILRHASGISFDISVDEALALWDFINAYRQTLLTIQQDRETDPHMQRVILDSDEN